MQYFIVFVAAVVLVLLARGALGPAAARRAVPVLLLAFALRLVVHVLVIRSGALDYGGDNFEHESRAMEIVSLWEREGIRYVTSDDIKSLYSVTVPYHIFAAVIYLCGGPAPLACTAVVALLACALCVIVYRLARLIGADERAAFVLLVITAFMPAFLYHTSDMFKDGFNAFLVIACLGLGASNARRLDVRKLLLLVPLLWALWYVRSYMVFMCAAPLLLSVTRLKHALSMRSLVLIVALLLASPTLIMDSAPVRAMQEQLDYGQSANVVRSNAEGGSGVVFQDGGNPWAALGPKLGYTLLSPFPWADGSLAFQLGKIEVLVWYVILLCAVSGAARLWRTDRRLFWFLLLFIVPSTIAYATAVANIGLIFRQRIPITMVTSLLAALAWTRRPPEEHTPTAPARRPRAAQPALSGRVRRT
ncbi:hypothetical protein [Nonomuraea pusilla]|uniref:Dolichyl-phosphate-mannose-protein mannosyltransferase n=1 Tax=Nonomuraea pusilla TaxID=46177 RepID=A0A1H7F9I8_9ACTN|nr:hypothetical protein [Nonomuraea pusilla]SEK22729.1 hypothetical protein SAMN05660976_00022 [Nonomuraea pusilla]